jgi:hypothetical protein
MKPELVAMEHLGDSFAPGSDLGRRIPHEPFEDYNHFLEHHPKHLASACCYSHLLKLAMHRISCYWLLLSHRIYSEYSILPHVLLPAEQLSEPRMAPCEALVPTRTLVSA